MTDVLLFANLPAELRESIERGAHRCLCPRCDGGTSREFSLDVRQDVVGVLKLKCYRASCGWFAISVTDPNAKLQSRQLKEPVVYRNPTIPIQGEVTRVLGEDYGCNVDEGSAHGWRLSEHGTELVMEIRDPFGQGRGHVTRTFTKPKRCYTFKATAQPWLDWWITPDAPVVVVEDCISACRLHGIGYTAVALLGTSLTVDQAREIAQHATGKVILALDRDAFEKSLHMAKRHSHVLTMHPICLTEDIKNMAFDADIIRVVGEQPQDG